MSSTSNPSGRPVGAPMFASCQHRHHHAIRRGSVLASVNPWRVNGHFVPGTHGNTATPAAAYAAAASASDSRAAIANTVSFASRTSRYSSAISAVVLRGAIVVSPEPHEPPTGGVSKARCARPDSQPDRDFRRTGAWQRPIDHFSHRALAENLQGTRKQHAEPRCVSVHRLME
jgi:hypothetical protein